MCASWDADGSALSEGEDKRTRSAAGRLERLRPVSPSESTLSLPTGGPDGQAGPPSPLNSAEEVALFMAQEHARRQAEYLEKARIEGIASQAHMRAYYKLRGARKSERLAALQGENESTDEAALSGEEARRERLPSSRGAKTDGAGSSPESAHGPWSE